MTPGYNLPDDTGPSDPEAPWNRERSAEDVTEEITQLRGILHLTEALALELEMASDYTTDLLSTAALSPYDCSNPVDMLEAMTNILTAHIMGLETQ